ncbi:MAG TPA: hypothetical protein VHH34_23185 [Pseudonocardiaceae bacterium]|nr:hypothetical protein [Pseudonocardiaceae bacterium]
MLEERASLANRIRNSPRPGGHELVEQAYSAAAQESAEAAAALRRLLLAGLRPGAGAPGGGPE